MLAAGPTPGRTLFVVRCGHPVSSNADFPPLTGWHASLPPPAASFLAVHRGTRQGVNNFKVRLSVGAPTSFTRTDKDVLSLRSEYSSSSGHHDHEGLARLIPGCLWSIRQPKQRRPSQTTSPPSALGTTGGSLHLK